MARVTYSMIVSLDGYVNDAAGGFAWAEPEEDLHRYFNARARATGTYLFGRRMYETMRVWDEMHDAAGLPEHIADFADAWVGSDKVVYSTTLDAVAESRTTLARSFDPAAVRALVATADKEIAVAGPGLAASAFRAGLVHEVELAVMPVIVGGGTRALPDGVRLDLDLIEQRAFASGVVLLRYAVLPATGA